jgi:hypothetical protein
MHTTGTVALLGSAAQAFADTKTAEVDLIANDLTELHGALEAILAACTELGRACTDYRKALDDLRTELSNLLKDLASEIAATAVIGVAASFISFGATVAVAAAKAAHSITKFAGLIRTAVSAWKISKAIRNGVKTLTELTRVRARLQRIKNLGRKGKREEPKPPTSNLPAGVKPGWVQRPADNGKGIVYQEPGAIKDQNSIRIMEPGADPRYPNGYVRFTNEHNQPINLDGKPGSPAETHIPRNPDGTYPLPKGWPR